MTRVIYDGSDKSLRTSSVVYFFYFLHIFFFSSLFYGLLFFCPSSNKPGDGDENKRLEQKRTFSFPVNTNLFQWLFLQSIFFPPLPNTLLLHFLPFLFFFFSVAQTFLGNTSKASIQEKQSLSVLTLISNKLLNKLK